MSIQDKIEHSTTFGQRLEDIIVNKGSITFGNAPDRDRLLVAYWALAMDYDKSILALLRQKFYGGAFALLRPLIEALVRAHVVLMGSDDDVNKIKADDYRTNFGTIGAEIDAAFNLEGFFDRLLNGAKGALHSFTHSGLSQLGRRFTGNDLQAHYSDGEIVEVIHTSSSAVFMVTNLVAKQFGFKVEAEEIGRLFMEWGKPQSAGTAATGAP
jgi:hypothetical protein